MIQPAVRCPGFRLVVLVVAPALALIGCSSVASGDTSEAASAHTSGTSTAAAADTSRPVIAEQKSLTVPGRPQDKVDVGLEQIKVDPGGRTMTLRLVFTPHFTTKGPQETVTQYDLHPGWFMLPTLLDREHLKEYSVLSGSGAIRWYESASGTGAQNGHPFESWFSFAAPQDPVTSLEVSVLDSWPPFTDVAVQR
jgi:hypothetical protein